MTVSFEELELGSMLRIVCLDCGTGLDGKHLGGVVEQSLEWNKFGFCIFHPGLNGGCFLWWGSCGLGRLRGLAGGRMRKK